MHYGMDGVQCPSVCGSLGRTWCLSIQTIKHIKKYIFNQHKFQHFHLQLGDQKEKGSDRIQYKFRFDPDPDPTFKKDRRSDLDPQKKGRDPDLLIMDRKILMPYMYINSDFPI